MRIRARSQLPWARNSILSGPRAAPLPRPPPRAYPAPFPGGVKKLFGISIPPTPSSSPSPSTSTPTPRAACGRARVMRCTGRHGLESSVQNRGDVEVSGGVVAPGRVVSWFLVVPCGAGCGVGGRHLGPSIMPTLYVVSYTQWCGHHAFYGGNVRCEYVFLRERDALVQRQRALREVGTLIASIRIEIRMEIGAVDGGA